MFEIVSLTLLGLNVFQLVYWSRQTHKLIDKVMSRNYAEYVQITTPPLPTVKVEDDSLIEEKDVLKELNGMFG